MIVSSYRNLCVYCNPLTEENRDTSAQRQKLWISTHSTERRQRKSLKWQRNGNLQRHLLCSSGQLQSAKYNHSLFTHIVPLFLKFYTIQSVQKRFSSNTGAGGLLRGNFAMLKWHLLSPAWTRCEPEDSVTRIHTWSEITVEKRHIYSKLRQGHSDFNSQNNSASVFEAAILICHNAQIT